MSTQTLILPYQRASPLHMQRRDLSLSSADSLALRVTIVETDDPSAKLLYLTGGLGGPALQFIVWRDSPSWCWDYGAPFPDRFPNGRELLWQGAGSISIAPGSFDIAIPAAAFTDWPCRCGFAVVLTSGIHAEALAIGMLHISRIAAVALPTPEAIATDDQVLITTD